jgi:hypothetical protein
MHDGELQPSTLRSAMESRPARDPELLRSRLDSELDWERVGADTVAFYRSLV